MVKAKSIFHNSRAWEKVRRRILPRDLYTCQLCGVILKSGRTDPRAANVDHIAPRHTGGGDEDENLRALCRQCNATRAENKPRKFGWDDGWETP